MFKRKGLRGASENRRKHGPAGGARNDHGRRKGARPRTDQDDREPARTRYERPYHRGGDREGDVKLKIFSDLAPHLKPETILTSNTSSISITRLAGRTERPEQFIGLHFVNPVSVMQLVELIRGIATNSETFEAVSAVVQRLGKTAVVAEDFPAFKALMPWNFKSDAIG
jgi:hypothetical protein